MKTRKKFRKSTCGCCFPFLMFIVAVDVKIMYFSIAMNTTVRKVKIIR